MKVSENGKDMNNGRNDSFLTYSLCNGLSHRSRSKRTPAESSLREVVGIAGLGVGEWRD